MLAVDSATNTHFSNTMSQIFKTRRNHKRITWICPIFFFKITRKIKSKLHFCSQTPCVEMKIKTNPRGLVEPVKNVTQSLISCFRRIHPILANETSSNEIYINWSKALTKWWDVRRGQQMPSFPTRYFAIMQFSGVKTTEFQCVQKRVLLLW